MKKTLADYDLGYVFLNIMLAIASLDTAYALYSSGAHMDKWYPGALFLLLLLPGKDMISRKHQKTAYIAAFIAGAIAVAFVISQVGIWILNIRYSAAVFNAAIGVMAVTHLIMFGAERKNRKTAA